MNQETVDRSYEWKAVTLLTLGFGLVGLDRWIIAPLFPAMAHDLHLNYQDQGTIVGILGVAWGVFAVVGGGLSDRSGAGVSGARDRGLLIAVWIEWSGNWPGRIARHPSTDGRQRGLILPRRFATTNHASKPTRRGFNLGIQQSAFPLFGLALGPILATQLMRVMTWRWVLLLVAVPGLVLAVLLWRTIREVKIGGPTEEHRAPLSHIMKHRNVPLGMLALFCAMSGLSPSARWYLATSSTIRN